MTIYSALNGPFRNSLPRVVNGQYIPLNILSDLCMKEEFLQDITRDEPFETTITRFIVRCRNRMSNLQHKIAYLNTNVTLDKFNGYVGIEDFGFLTRHLPLVQTDSWIISHWKSSGRMMSDYIKFVVRLSVELDSLLREIFPLAGIIACETFDISHYTAMGQTGPHPHFKKRWRQSRKLCINIPFIHGTSLYRTNQPREEYRVWVEAQRSFADVAYVTPFKSSTGICSIDEFRETLEIVQESFDKIFIWSRPQSETQAALIRALVGSVVVTNT